MCVSVCVCEREREGEIQRQRGDRTREREREDDRVLIGVSSCKLLLLEWISNEILLYSTGNYIQSFVMEHGGR